MSFWPRMRLTPGEKRRGVTKYFCPDTGKRGVLRRIYPGQLLLNANIRQPIFNFEIARRSRVFGLTGSGDIGQFRVQMRDSSGENYMATPVSLASLLMGYVEIPPTPYGSSSVGPAGGYPVLNPENGAGWREPVGMPRTAQPFIIEPNIVLASNQVVTIEGSAMSDYAGTDFRVDLCVHVWEFPSYSGGPA